MGWVVRGGGGGGGVSFKGSSFKGFRVLGAFRG